MPEELLSRNLQTDEEAELEVVDQIEFEFVIGVGFLYFGATVGEFAQVSDEPEAIVEGIGDAWLEGGIVALLGRIGAGTVEGIVVADASIDEETDFAPLGEAIADEGEEREDSVGMGALVGLASGGSGVVVKRVGESDVEAHGKVVVEVIAYFRTEGVTLHGAGVVAAIDRTAGVID